MAVQRYSETGTMKRFCLLILFAVLIHGTASAETFAVSSFAVEGLSGWDVKKFKGLTSYSLIKENGTTILKADSKGTASGIFKKIALSPRKYRYLNWSWKVAGTIAKGDENSKSGDDYAARVYVIFPGRFFWQTRAINYIWANRLPAGQSIRNAYTGNAMMVAVESGTLKAGQWQHEQRDILADYRRLFGSEPGEIGAVAIMTDTDNTGEEATAWYGDISLSTGR